MTSIWSFEAITGLVSGLLLYFGTASIGKSLVWFHHRRALREMRAEYDWEFTPIVATEDKLTEQRMKELEDKFQKLQAEMNARSDTHSNVTVTKPSGVPATTPHVEDDPRWRWDDGKWVERTPPHLGGVFTGLDGFLSNNPVVHLAEAMTSLLFPGGKL